MVHACGAGLGTIAPIRGSPRSVTSTMAPVHITANRSANASCRLPPRGNLKAECADAEHGPRDQGPIDRLWHSVRIGRTLLTLVERRGQRLHISVAVTGDGERCTSGVKARQISFCRALVRASRVRSAARSWPSHVQASRTPAYLSRSFATRAPSGPPIARASSQAQPMPQVLGHDQNGEHDHGE
jgi:hypothetical protein